MSVRTKVLLYSAGLDSAAMRLLWEPDVCLYVNMGTRYAAAEMARLDPSVHVLHLPGLGGLARADDIIPMRNLILVALASSYGEDIGLAATAGDRVLDKSKHFANQAGWLLSYLWSKQWWTEARRIVVHLPLKDMTKREILAACANAGHDLEALARNSFSCYHPVGDRECGQCKPCWRKWVAFACHGLNVNPRARDYVTAHIAPSVHVERPEEEQDVTLALENTA